MSITDKIVKAFINYPEMVTDNMYTTSKDCITGKPIQVGTRIVTTSLNTKKKYGIEKFNVTMTVDTFKSLNTKHTRTRNGQVLWNKDFRDRQYVLNKIYIPHNKNYYTVDLSDIDEIFNS